MEALAPGSANAISGCGAGDLHFRVHLPRRRRLTMCARHMGGCLEQNKKSMPRAINPNADREVHVNLPVASRVLTIEIGMLRLWSREFHYDPKDGTDLLVEVVGLLHGNQTNQTVVLLRHCVEPACNRVRRGKFFHYIVGLGLLCHAFLPKQRLRWHLLTVGVASWFVSLPKTRIPAAL